jgi:hypothetical protein
MIGMELSGRRSPPKINQFSSDYDGVVAFANVERS